MSAIRKNLIAAGVGLALVAGPLAAIAIHEHAQPEPAQTAAVREPTGPVVIDNIRAHAPESVSLDNVPVHHAERSTLAEDIADAHDLDVVYTDDERNCGTARHQGNSAFYVGSCWRADSPETVFVSPAAQHAFDRQAREVVRDVTLIAVAHRDIYETCGAFRETEVAEAYATLFLGARHDTSRPDRDAAGDIFKGRCEQ